MRIEDVGASYYHNLVKCPGFVSKLSKLKIPSLNFVKIGNKTRSNLKVFMVNVIFFPINVTEKSSWFILHNLNRIVNFWSTFCPSATPFSYYEIVYQRQLVATEVETPANNVAVNGTTHRWPYDRWENNFHHKRFLLCWVNNFSFEKTASMKNATKGVKQT